MIKIKRMEETIGGSANQITGMVSNKLSHPVNTQVQSEILIWTQDSLSLA